MGELSPLQAQVPWKDPCAHSFFYLMSRLQGHLNASTSLADSAVGDAPAHPTAEAAGEEQEPHYASLIFQGLRPWKPQVQEDSSTTVYSEIRVQK